MHKSFIKIFVPLTMAFALFASRASATEITFATVPNTTGDGATVINATIDPQGQDINVVDGTIVFSGAASGKLSVQVLNGNSVLAIWPTPPVFAPDQKTITFTGGVPLGISKAGLLFQMRLSAAAGGDATLALTDAHAYLDDGQGTAQTVSAQPLTVSFNQKNNSRFDWRKYVIIILLIVIAVAFAYRYAYKKFFKK